MLLFLLLAKQTQWFGLFVSGFEYLWGLKIFNDFLMWVVTQIVHMAEQMQLSSQEKLKFPPSFR